ncbi:amidohydrolase family protein [Sphingomonas faeni]|uniref:amidohydrolase family protein n=1 Tax=Sphingomonas faeni TaxID=185950 RepID=UPI002412ECB3|nr:amidohydrolase family protein [Sphingomonas faeni]
MSNHDTVAMDLPRGDYLIRGCRVITLDPQLGELDRADVLVRAGVIVAVDTSLPADGAELIDASGLILMPGFVETHWHMWNSIWRGLAHDAPGYFALHRLAASYTAEDHYAAVRYAATEAINAGVTTCHNWSNALRGEADAQAQGQALVDSGIRARFGYGHLPGPETTAVGDDEIATMLAWLDEHGDHRIDLGVVIHSSDHFVAEVEAARRHGLKSIAPHADLSQVLHLLGPDFIFTHGPGTPDGFIRLLASKGVKVALCPATDPLIGAGLPPIARFVENGIPFGDIGFSVDVTAQTCVDPFAAMRTIMASARIAEQRGASFTDIIFRPGDPNDATNGLTMPRQMLQLATLNGARVLGLDNVVGSITPGKRADLILVRTTDLNMIAVDDCNATFQLVQHGQPHNVDAVMVDGRFLKRDGRLLNADVRAIGAAAARAHEGVRHRAGLTCDLTL